MTASSLIEGIVDGTIANYGSGDIQKDFDKLDSASFGMLRTLAERYGLEVIPDYEMMLHSIMTYLHGDNWLDKLGKS